MGPGLPMKRAAAVLIPLLLMLAFPLPAVAARVDGNISLVAQMGGTLSSYSWAQYYDTLGFTHEIYIAGTHSISGDVDILQWATYTGHYEGTRQGSGQCGTQYQARNYAQAHPLGPEVDEHVPGGPWTADATTPNCPPPPPPPPPEDIQECTPYCSPLVLDIAGDGIATTGAENPVRFDVDADGVIDTIGWLAHDSDDAFLWRDLEKNHRVDDGSELFGVGMSLPDGRRATDGFEALAAYDRYDNGGNEDGVINNRDAVWRRLRLWTDLNHNGLSEREELSPIQSSRVIALSLSSMATSETDAAGNQIRLRSTYRYRLEGGRSEDRALIDVFFRRIQPSS